MMPLYDCGEIWRGDVRKMANEVFVFVANFLRREGLINER